MSCDLEVTNEAEGTNCWEKISSCVTKFISFFKVYLCHDHDTGSELAVKQVEVGLLNKATQKVRQRLNKVVLLSWICTSSKP